MSELLLDSLEIIGYRCFEHLTIEKLGRVNLIVGKNNVGKTALLEGLWIYARRGNMLTLIDLLAGRNELPLFVDNVSLIKTLPLEQRYDIEELRSELKNLFYSRPNLEPDSSEIISIGSKNSKINVFTTRLIDKNGQPTQDYSFFENNFGVRPVGLILVSHLQEGVKSHRTEFFSIETAQSLLLENPPEKLPSSFIKSRGLDVKSLTRFWDDAYRNKLDIAAISFMRIIEPKLSDINFIGVQNGTKTRIPIASYIDSPERTSLDSHGEGMSRLLGVALALANCKNGILLIDEIEGGLHYSVQADVWKLIFKTARELNVQVFATTHSQDCIKAFAQAAEESPEDGMLIRLERQGEEIVAKLISEERLELAINHSVEVR